SQSGTFAGRERSSVRGSQGNACRQGPGAARTLALPEIFTGVGSVHVASVCRRLEPIRRIQRVSEDRSRRFVNAGAVNKLSICIYLPTASSGTSPCLSDDRSHSHASC